MQIKQLQGFMRVVNQNKKVANVDFKGIGLYMAMLNKINDVGPDQKYTINLNALAGTTLAKKHVLNHLQNFEKVGAIKIVSVDNNSVVINITRYQ